MKIVFRIFDNDASRAQRTELMLYENMKANQIDGNVSQVACIQEFGRQGIVYLPALELNGIMLSQGELLTGSMLADICARLAYAIKKMGISS